MSSSDITLPLWLFVPIALLAFTALSKWLLSATISRFYHRRASSNTHLLDSKFRDSQSPAIKHRRGAWIDKLLSDPEVIRAIELEADSTGKSVTHLHHIAEKYADELVPSFNVPFYFRIGYWLARCFLHFCYWHKVAYAAERQYENIDSNSCIIIVANHRSNFDPLFLLHLASRHSAISFSAGDWARKFPLKQIIQAIGFYIVRRDSDNKLYLKILERYIFLAVGHCIPQGLFVGSSPINENGLKSDGVESSKKLSLLNYVAKSINQGHCKDIIFIPAALNYGKIPGDKSLLNKQDGDHDGKDIFKSVRSTLQSIALLLRHCLPYKYKPFGYAAINYGEPISLRQWQHDNKIDLNNCTHAQGQAAINRLEQEIAEEITSQLPILPVSILAVIFLELGDQVISELDIKVKASKLLFTLRDRGRHMPIPESDEDFALQQGLYTLRKYKLIEKLDNGLYQGANEQHKLFKFYADPIGTL